MSNITTIEIKNTPTKPIVGSSTQTTPMSVTPRVEREKEWRFSQCFGEAPSADLTEADILSAIEFDGTGQYLATGDRGGRIVVFDVDEITSTPETKSKSTNSSSSAKANAVKPIEYKFHCEFQSHEPEFDYLKSLEIEEKINQIKWCPPNGNSLMLLSTNDKTIKLWKLSEKQIKTVSTMNVDRTSSNKSESDSTMASASSNKAAVSSSSSSPMVSTPKAKAGAKFASAATIKIPKLNHVETVISCNPRRVYGHAHAYHINSISVNSDGESFISADDLRINLWHMDHANQSYTILDIKPENMEELTEVITSADFHPSHCNIFIYSSSKGAIKMCDMREKSLCDQYAKVYQEMDNGGEKSFYSEIIASISDCKFSKDGRYMISRDYMSMKIWDVRMENKPTQSYHVHDHLRPKLADLYEKDQLFDKFKCVISGDSRYVATGSYNNYFHIYDVLSNTDTCLEATNNIPPRKKVSVSHLAVAIAIISYSYSIY